MLTDSRNILLVHERIVQIVQFAFLAKIQLVVVHFASYVPKWRGGHDGEANAREIGAKAKARHHHAGEHSRADEDARVGGASKLELIARRSIDEGQRLGRRVTIAQPFQARELLLRIHGRSLLRQLLQPLVDLFVGEHGGIIVGMKLSGSRDEGHGWLCWLVVYLDHNTHALVEETNSMPTISTLPQCSQGYRGEWCDYFHPQWFAYPQTDFLEFDTTRVEFKAKILINLEIMVQSN